MALVSFGSLTGLGTSPNVRRVEVVEAHLRNLLDAALKDVVVDENWYREAYPDVDEAIRDGIIVSARAHYLTAGYFEDRLPHPMVVDEEWYLDQHPDVKSAVSRGYFSAQQHFEVSGYREGRIPYAGWKIKSMGHG
jgi:hypothetical protein